jgi:hypothetical protein
MLAGSILGSLSGGVLLALLLVAGALNRLGQSAAGVPTPVLTLIAAPSPTPLPSATPLPTVTSEPTHPPTEPPDVGGLRLGDLVEILGTGGAGLRLRDQPGLAGLVEGLALEHEVFEITGGPVSADGYRWWYLTSPYDVGQSGWGAANYLRPVVSP